MSYNNRTRSLAHGVCKRAISNRRNARKVNPRTGWSSRRAHTVSPFVVHGRFRPFVSRSCERVMRAGEPLLSAIPAARVAPARAPFVVDPFGAYIYTCTRTDAHIHEILCCLLVCVRNIHTHTSKRGALTYTRALAPVTTYIGVYTITEYCIMQPLIAVLSFTHAICCSRCNPCPVTASSVQSPSR